MSAAAAAPTSGSTFAPSGFQAGGLQARRLVSAAAAAPTSGSTSASTAGATAVLPSWEIRIADVGCHEAASHQAVDVVDPMGPLHQRGAQQLRVHEEPNVLDIDNQVVGSEQPRREPAPCKVTLDLARLGLNAKHVLYCRQRLFDQPLPGGEPVLSGLSSWVRSSPPPTRPVSPARLVQHVPVFLGNLGLSRHVNASITPNLSSLPSAQYRSNSC